MPPARKTAFAVNLPAMAEAEAKIILKLEAEESQMPAKKAGNKLWILIYKSQDTFRIIFIKIKNISNFYGRGDRP